MDRQATIVIAEDDDDDYLLTEKALMECGFSGDIRRVTDGDELLAFLLRQADAPASREDRAIMVLLLDLNMPGKDGREALKEIKSNPKLRKIPVVILTTSGAEADVAMAYDAGANSFIRKPASFERFVEAVASLKKYWLEVAELPHWQGGREPHG